MGGGGTPLIFDVHIHQCYPVINLPTPKCYSPPTHYDLYDICWQAVRVVREPAGAPDGDGVAGHHD